MPPIWWPRDELIGDAIDQAKKKWESLTANAAGIARQPIDLAIARRQYDQLTGGIAESAGRFADLPRRLEDDRKRFEELTTGHLDTVRESVGRLGDLNAAATGALNTTAEQFGTGFGERLGRTEEQPYTPGSVPNVTGQVAGGITSGATEPFSRTGERIGANIEGATQMAAGLGAPEPLARGIGIGLGALGAGQSAAGAAMETGARNVGLSPDVARGIGDVSEAISPSPFMGDKFGALTKARLGAAGVGAAAGAGIGAAVSPEEDRGLGAIRGAATGFQLGPTAVDLAQGAGRLAGRIAQAGREAPIGISTTERSAQGVAQAARRSETGVGAYLPYESVKGQGTEFADSSYEFAVMRKLDENDHVASWTKKLPEEHRISWTDEQGVQRSYLPDYLVNYKDGSQELLEVKAAWRLPEPGIQARVAAGSQYAKSKGMAFNIAAEDEIGRNYLREFDTSQFDWLNEAQRNDLARRLHRVSLAPRQGFTATGQTAASRAMRAVAGAGGQEGRTDPEDIRFLMDISREAQDRGNHQAAEVIQRTIAKSVPEPTLRSVMEGVFGPASTGGLAQAERASVPFGAAAGALTAPEGASPEERIKRGIVGGLLAPGAVRSAAQLGRILKGGEVGREALGRIGRLQSMAGELPGGAGTHAERLEQLRGVISEKLNRYDDIGTEIERVQTERAALQDISGEGQIERPSKNDMRAWGFGNLSDADLYEIARRSEVNPHTPGWFDALDPETVRLYKQEAQSRRGPKPLTPKQQLTELRKQERALAAEQRQLDQQLVEHYNQEASLEEQVTGVKPPPASSVEPPGPMLPPRRVGGPGGGPIPQGPPPEGVGVMAPGRPAGTPQISMEGQPPTREGAVFPERFPPPAPERPGVAVNAAGQGPLAGPTEVGRVFPENFPPEAPPRPGVAVQSTPRTPMEPSTEVGRVFPGNMPEQRPPTQAAEAALARARAEIQSGRLTADGVGRQAADAVAAGAISQEEADWVTGNLARAEIGRPGVAITAPGAGPLAGPTEVGRAFPERFPPEAPREGVAVLSSPRGVDEKGVGRQMMPGMEDTLTETGRVFPGNFPDPNAPPAPPSNVPPPRPPAPPGDTPLSQPDVPGPRGQLPIGDLAESDLTPGTPGAVEWVQKRAGVINQARYISLLSGTSGAFGDIVANVVNIPRLYWRTAVGAGVERAFRVPMEQRATTGSQLTGLNRGLREGSIQAVKEAWDVFMEGMPAADRATEALNPDIGRNTTFTGKKWLPLAAGYRIRLAADALVTNLGERMASYSMGYREADRAGLKAGSAAHTEYAENVTRHVQGEMQRLRAQLEPGERVAQGGVTQRLAARPTDYATGGKGYGSGLKSPFGDRLDYTGLAREAFTISKDLAFQRELGRSARWLAQGRSEVPVLGSVVPFFRTTTRIAADMLQEHPVLGPIGTTQDAIKAAFGHGPYAALEKGPGGGNILARSRDPSTLPMSQRLADHSLGAMVTATGAVLAANGVITALGPTDTSVQRKMRDEGWRPLSLVIPDGQGGIRGYIPLTRLLGPHAMALGLGATLYEMKQRGEPDSPLRLVQDFVISQEGQWSQQSGLRDIYELLNGVFSPDPQEQGRTWEKLAANVTGQYVPFSGLLHSVEQFSDPVVRDPRNFVERLMAGIPGVAGLVEPRTTETGSVVGRGSGEGGLRSLLPFQEIAATPSERQFYGSASAEQDAEITRAINTVKHYQSNPDQYAAPTQRQEDLYYEFAGQRSGEFTTGRREERARRRERARAEEESFLGFQVPTSAGR